MAIRLPEPPEGGDELEGSTAYSYYEEVVAPTERKRLQRWARRQEDFEVLRRMEEVAAIADGRGIDAIRVRELADTGPRTAIEARDAGLVDVLGYRDQAYAAMRSRVGSNVELLFADRWRPRLRPRVPHA